ncbi:phosphopentomutase [Proteinivorax hydrogeniformans]|uniref:Phosphopentomutase n=1 Tax=Proteinivorax hydrogeniformans TaxID=1826727 RepID=A0AAU8HXG0_9FIRM
MNRTILIVLDSVGIGALPDANQYNDEGSNTLANIAKEVGGLKLDTLESLGLGNIHPIEGVKKQEQPLASYGKMAEKSPGKDTTTGHWEMAGVVLEHPFPVYPEGFPKELLEEFEQKIGTKTLGNKVASGTKIIEELGSKHQETGYPIVYTSADSVFQIAAHEEVVPLDRLYEMCLIAREMLQGEHGVGRVIARPFIGDEGQYKRTSNRKDYSRLPHEETVLQTMQKSGKDVIGIGKISDIYAGLGVTKSYKSKSNSEGLSITLERIKEDSSGLIMLNLVDFDMLYGHRNDVLGYAKSLEEADKMLSDIIKHLKDDDLLIITADHGCDPTHPGTDHTREFVPLLVYGKNHEPKNLGVREAFTDVAQTLSEIFTLGKEFPGKSLL